MSEVMDVPTFELKSRDGKIEKYSSTLTWGKEKKLLNLIGGVLKEFTTTDETGTIRVSPERLVSFFSTEAPELVTEAVSIITGQSLEDIDESYTGQDILEFTIPFLIAFIRRFANTISFATASDLGQETGRPEIESAEQREKENLD